MLDLFSILGAESLLLAVLRNIFVGLWMLVELTDKQEGGLEGVSFF